MLMLCVCGHATSSFFFFSRLVETCISLFISDSYAALIKRPSLFVFVVGTVMTQVYFDITPRAREGVPLSASRG